MVLDNEHNALICCFLITKPLHLQHFNKGLAVQIKALCKAHNKLICPFKSPVCQKSWEVASTTHVKLLQHMVRPRRELLFAELAFKIFCPHVVPTVDAQHFPHSSIQACLSKFDDLLRDRNTCKLNDSTFHLRLRVRPNTPT